MSNSISRKQFDSLYSRLAQGQQEEVKGNIDNSRRQYTVSGRDLYVRNSSSKAPFWDRVDRPSSGAVTPPAPQTSDTSSWPGRLPPSLGNDIKKAIRDTGGTREDVSFIIGYSDSRNFGRVLRGDCGMSSEKRDRLINYLQQIGYSDLADEVNKSRR